MSPWDSLKSQISEIILKAEIPENNEWCLYLLKKMLATKMENESNMEDRETLSKMIDSMFNS